MSNPRIRAIRNKARRESYERWKIMENSSDKIPEQDYMKEKIDTKELSKGFHETFDSIKKIILREENRMDKQEERLEDLLNKTLKDYDLTGALKTININSNLLARAILKDGWVHRDDINDTYNPLLNSSSLKNKG